MVTLFLAYNSITGFIWPIMYPVLVSSVQKNKYKVHHHHRKTEVYYRTPVSRAWSRAAECAGHAGHVLLAFSGGL